MAELTSPYNQVFNTRFNRYYNYITNAVFYAKAPRYLYQWYQNSVREWDYWLSGWVPGLHDVNRGIMPTQFASCLCGKLSDVIWGDGMVFKSTADDKANDKSLDFVSNELDDAIGLRDSYKDLIQKTVQFGNGLLKINCDNDLKLWVDTIGGNRFFCALDSRGNIVWVQTFVNIFTSGTKGDDRSFALCEERYWKNTEDGRVPVAVYNIYRVSNANVFTASNGQSLSYKDLPRGVQDTFRREYGDIYLGEEQRLPLINLGVYLAKYTSYIEGLPNVKMGESALSKVLNDLAYYDLLASENFNDVYISRSKVIMPQFMNKNNARGNGYLNGLDDFVFAKIPNVSDKDQTPIIYKPEMRVTQLTAAMQECIRTIAMKIGIAASAIASDLQEQHGTFTATQVTSQNNNTVLYSKNKRTRFTSVFNDVLTDILHFYGREDTVNINWASEGGSNQAVLIDNITRLRSAGLISDKEAQETLHAGEWTNDQIEAEVKDSVEDTTNIAELQDTK